ncbi:hypothetical protein SLA2020_448760 [Shorea laevis]
MESSGGKWEELERLLQRKEKKSLEVTCRDREYRLGMLIGEEIEKSASELATEVQVVALMPWLLNSMVGKKVDLIGILKILELMEMKRKNKCLRKLNNF